MNKQLSLPSLFKTLAMTIIVVGGAVLITKWLGPIPLSITQTVTQKGTTFDATGDAEITAVPDEAQVRLGIEVQQSTVDTAQEEANQIINNITQAIKKLGVDKEDIQTQSYQVNPNYDWSDDNRRITGYQVSTQVLVKVTDFEKLNQIIDTGTNLGANQVGGINFSLSDAKQEELKKEARQEAIDEAKASAEELAKLAGVKLGKVVNVYENAGNNYDYPAYEPKALIASDEGMGESTQLEPGSEIYRYSVTLSFETL